MKIGFIGLGRMGSAIVKHLVEEGVSVVMHNRSYEKVEVMLKEYHESRIMNHESRGKRKISTHDSEFMIHDSRGKLEGSESVMELIGKLSKPRIVWLMVPHGKPVDDMIATLLEAGLEKGDIVVDGGNSYFEDTMRRYKELKKKGINYMDCGTSGGLEGAREGACLMVGGEREIFLKLKPVMEKMAGTKGAVTYFGPSGAGHFVKMVHNGVEYGMLQSIGEGFDLLKNGPYKLDMQGIASNWIRGSVVRGWLMELLERALKNDPGLEKASGEIGGGETGEWTVRTAEKSGVGVPALEAAMKSRKDSLKKRTYAGKVIASLRYEFGGHGK